MDILQCILLRQAKICLQFPSARSCRYCSDLGRLAAFVTQHLETSRCPSRRCAERSGRQAGAHGRGPWGPPGAVGACSPSAAQPWLRGSLPVPLEGGVWLRMLLCTRGNPRFSPMGGKEPFVACILYLSDRLHPRCINGKGMAAEKPPGDGQSNETCPGEGVPSRGLGGVG